MKLSTKLLKWYEKNKRDLPWRKTKDPYRILVSEIMLQQTQVDRVKVFYQDWLKKFPTWKKLAQASNAEVISAWQGLGYNRRALALRDIAKQVVETGVPGNREEWMKLKGVGPYTSAALALFAQNERVFPIDSIIRRVGGRLFLGEPFADSKADVEIEEAGLQLLAVKNYQDIPQAFFDLGTDICKKNPDCNNCPLVKNCLASEKFLTGQVEIPKRSVQKSFEKIHRNKKYPDRIFRGRILKLVSQTKESIEISRLGFEIDEAYDVHADHEWLENMVQRLVKDGMVVYSKGKVSFIE